MTQAPDAGLELEAQVHLLLLEHVAGVVLAAQPVAMAEAVKASLIRSCDRLDGYSGGPIDAAALQGWHAILAGRMKQVLARIEVVERSLRGQSDPPEAP